MSRAEKLLPTKENSGSVAPTIQERISRRPIRMNMARNSPSFRLLSRVSRGSLSTRIEMKIMLSIPKTSSSTVRVRNAIHIWGSSRMCMVNAL
jgi:hypothetical protein